MPNHVLLILALLCGLTLFAASAFAADKVLDASLIDKEPVSLTEYFAVLEDPSLALTLADVQKPEVATRFKTDMPAAEALSYGYTRSAYWLRLTIRNDAARTVERMLEIAYPRLTNVQFHATDADGGYRTLNTGSVLPFATRPYKNRYFVFPISLPAHAEQVIYFRLQAIAPIIVPARLWSPQAFHAYERQDYIGQSLYFGLSIGMVLFNLLLFLVLRDSIYLLYVSFVTVAALTIGSQNGLTKEFLWPTASHWSDAAITVGFSLCFVTLLTFMRRMLYTAREIPRFDRVLRFFIAVCLVFPIGAFASLQTFSRPSGLLYGGLAILTLGTGLYCVFQRQRSAYFFVGAFALICLGGVMNVLLSLGLVPSNMLTVNGIQFGSAMEMIVLAIALADRFNEIRREKAKDQRALLAAQQELVDSLKNSERVLEERVERRTAALRESNQSLDTAKKEAVQALATIQSILDAAPVGISLLDAQLRHTHINRQYVETTGRLEQEWLGQTHQFAFPSEAEFERFVKDSAEPLLAGRTFGEELQLIHRDGSRRWINAQVTAIDPKDFSRGFVTTCEDIDGRKQSEREIQAAHQELQATLHDLRATQAQLIQAEKMASLGQLVANVAHEINTPIGAVKSSGKNIDDALDEVLDKLPRLFDILDLQARSLFSRLVKSAKASSQPRTTREERAIKNIVAQQLEADGIADADRKARILVKLRAESAPLDYLPLLEHEESDFILDTAQSLGSIINSTSNIHTAVDRVSKIVTTLKSFSQADNIGEMTDTRLQDGLETVLAIYSNQLKQGTELVRQYEDISPLRCLPDELTQVWTHLIHNALQAMDYQGKLTIGLRREGNAAVVSVTDSGSGIPDAIRSRIFEPFFTTRPAGEGSGLGLDIVKKIVDKHQGRIDVQSTVGVGATFSVYLPYSRGNS